MDSHTRMRELLAQGVDLHKIEAILDFEYPLQRPDQTDDLPEQVTAPAA